MGADERRPLTVVKTATPDTAEPTQIVTYTIALDNERNVTTTVRLTDTLSGQVVFLGPLIYDTGSGGHASGVITWTGTVYTATPTLIAWQVQINPDVSYSSTIVNSAVISDAYGLFNTEPVVVLVPARRIYLPFVIR
jgi:uncharacterized repeat protein (TIGR01451 family)